MKWTNVFIIVSLAVITSAIVAAHSGDKTNIAESDDWLEMKEHHTSMHGDDFEEHHQQIHGDDWEEHMRDCHNGDPKAMHGSSGMMGHM